MTLRELAAMAEGRNRAEWSRTSSLMAHLANCNRASKRDRVYHPRDFDPYARPEKPIKVGIGVLKDVFINRKLPEEIKP